MTTIEQRAELYRTQLLRLLLVLFEDIGLTESGAPLTGLSTFIRKIILRFLSPAESAVRRLIEWRLAQMGLPDAEDDEVEKKSTSKTKKKSGKKRKSGTRKAVFWLCDKRKYFWELSALVEGENPGPPPCMTDGLDGQRTPRPKPDPGLGLCRRMQALLMALNDIDGQARRMLILKARRKKNPPGPGCVPPIRPGPPPGFRRNKTREVDTILAECHTLAYNERNKIKPP